MHAVINIHAKFRKMFVMNGRSPWLPLDNKYLQGRGLFAEPVVNIIKGYTGRIHSRSIVAHFEAARAGI
jgi:hypothetical protein